MIQVRGQDKGAWGRIASDDPMLLRKDMTPAIPGPDRLTSPDGWANNRSRVYAGEWMTMKRCMTLPAVALLFCFLLGGTGVSLAADSGEERTIPIIEWECWGCKHHYFTFAPDSLDGKILQHKDPNFQQSRWLILKTRSPIRKCEKMFDGTHIFDKKKELLISGYTLMASPERFVVIKGGQAVKATINKVQCVGCQRGAYAFSGDDLDQWGVISSSEIPAVFAMKSGSKIGTCDKLRLPSGGTFKPHLFDLKGPVSMSSDAIAQNFGSFLCSD